MIIIFANAYVLNSAKINNLVQQFWSLDGNKLGEILGESFHLAEKLVYALKRRIHRDKNVLEEYKNWLVNI